MFIVFGIFDGFGFDFEPGFRRGLQFGSFVIFGFGPTLNNEIPCFYFQNAFSLYYTIISINSVDL